MTHATLAFPCPARSKNQSPGLRRRPPVHHAKRRSHRRWVHKDPRRVRRIPLRRETRSSHPL